MNPLLGYSRSAWFGSVNTENSLPGWNLGSLLRYNLWGLGIGGSLRSVAGVKELEPWTVLNPEVYILDHQPQAQSPRPHPY